MKQANKVPIQLIAPQIRNSLIMPEIQKIRASKKRNISLIIVPFSNLPGPFVSAEADLAQAFSQNPSLQNYASFHFKCAEGALKGVILKNVRILKTQTRQQATFLQNSIDC